jgi:lipopolysaccharide/colanic/teichoic acid biosynthesis glycosyltransferase
MASYRQSGQAGVRAFDCVSALVLGVVAAPFVLIAAVAIRLDSRGPVLYRQVRVGQEGRPFWMLKLRTMQVDAEADGVARWAVSRDQRVTRVGRALRRCRIDEVPQLWNVVRGDKSLIGPRPERPPFVDTLSRELPGYSLRHRVKPGLTGWAQVRCGYASCIDEAARKLEHDLFYVSHRNWRLDLRIVLETIFVVLLGIGSR